jgi:hypothetical protein
MHLQLLIPGLIWPEATASLPPLPSLELLLARGRRSTAAAPDASAWLFAAYDVARDDTAQRDWPVAPFARLADGCQPDTVCWICADPVHLRLQRDALLLADARLLAITREEADALVASLNAHFSADGFTLQAPHPDRWYAALAQAPEISTTPLALAAGQSVDPKLPRGAGAAAWHARMNEVQMLLHAHPVNAAREARGQMPVNSLWFWGAGVLPRNDNTGEDTDTDEDPDESAGDEKPSHLFSRVWAADPLARGLARWRNAPALDLPASAQALLDGASAEGVGLALLDGLEAARSYGDLGAWEARLRELESNWFAPLVAALRERRIGMLSVHGFGGGKPFSVEAVRHDFGRFWRRPKPLAKQIG